MDQYITLVSNASMDIFPENRLSSFRVRLPYLIDLDSDDWTVGLTEITYTKSWFNVGDGHYISPAFIDDGTLVPHLSPLHRTKLLAANYATPKDFIDHINSVAATWTQKTGNVIKAPVYQLNVNQTLSLKQAGLLKASADLAKEFACSFDKATGEILGLKSRRPVFLEQGMTNLYIYCDIVQPQVVGDSLHPLLRTVGVDSDAPFGSNVTEIFETPYYLPLSRTSFQEIEINIRGDTGKAPSFSFGRVTVTLHLLKQ